MDETSREEMKRLRERALAAHAADHYTAVSVHFLIKLMDALLDEVQDRGAVPYGSTRHEAP